MKQNFKTPEQYYIQVFDRLMLLAPIVGISAAMTFTFARIAGNFESTSLTGLILFDIICFSYLAVARYLKHRRIHTNGKLDSHRLFVSQLVLSALIILQWNLISYIFPERDFWGYAFLFILLSAFMYDTRIVAITSGGVYLSIIISWLLKGELLLPVRDSSYMENLILRSVALVVTFAVIYALTYFANRFVRLTKENAESLEKQNFKLETLSRDIIDFTADIIEKRDATSGEHVQRVKYYTRTLAEQIAEDCPEYGLVPEQINLISIASSLHDVGKISIPDSILLKPGKLTPEEFDVIKTHTLKGADIIDKLPESVEPEFRKYCKEICRYHHEKYDGKGYPCGLTGDDIPLSAQIVSIVDCFDALTTDRPYKQALPGEVALKMIFNGDCGAFSDKILSSFLRCKDRFVNPKTIR